MSSFEYEDEFVELRGKYKLTQPLDYSSLSYSASLDYPLEFDGKVYYPGGDKKLWEERQAGKHRKSDWAWRWSKPAVEWGIQEGLIVLRGDRIYTKTYSKCRKKNGLNELEYVDTKKAYGQERFRTLKEKIEWVCRNFEGTQKILESDADWKKRLEEDK